MKLFDHSNDCSIIRTLDISTINRAGARLYLHQYTKKRAINISFHPRSHSDVSSERHRTRFSAGLTAHRLLIGCSLQRLPPHVSRCSILDLGAARAISFFFVINHPERKLCTTLTRKIIIVLSLTRTQNRAYIPSHSGTAECKLPYSTPPLEIIS